MISVLIISKLLFAAAKEEEGDDEALRSSERCGIHRFFGSKLDNCRSVEGYLEKHRFYKQNRYKPMRRNIQNSNESLSRTSSMGSRRLRPLLLQMPCRTVMTTCAELRSCGWRMIEFGMKHSRTTWNNHFSCFYLVNVVGDS